MWTSFERGDVEQAARAADARMALDPGDVAWRKEWIKVVSEVPARLTEVIAASRALAREHPRDAEVQALLGKVLMATDEALPEAVRAYRAALAIDPRNLDARKGLARALSLSARYDEAIAGYRSVIDEAPDTATEKELAETLVAAGRYGEAVAAYQVVVKAVPDDRGARGDLARALFSAGRPFDAMHVLDALLAENPRDADALRARAQIARRQGDFDTARILLERASGVETAYTPARAGPLGAVPIDITLPLLFALMSVSIAIGYVSQRLTPWTYLVLAGSTAGLVGLALSLLYLDY